VGFFCVADLHRFLRNPREDAKKFLGKSFFSLGRFFYIYDNQLNIRSWK
jgi:hypothetical protein